MKQASIRPATPGDIPALCKLYHAFHEFHAEGVPARLNSLGPWEQFDASQLRRGLQEILDNEQACLYIAEVEGELAGFAEIYLRQDEPNPARASYDYAHLQSLLVARGFRKQGLGRHLVQAAEVWARQQGAVEVRLETWEFPDGPAQFYERIGYRTIKRTLSRRL